VKNIEFLGYNNIDDKDWENFLNSINLSTNEDKKIDLLSTYSKYHSEYLEFNKPNRIEHNKPTYYSIRVSQENKILGYIEIEIATSSSQENNFQQIFNNLVINKWYDGSIVFTIEKDNAIFFGYSKGTAQKDLKLDIKPGGNYEKGSIWLIRNLKNEKEAKPFFIVALNNNIDFYKFYNINKNFKIGKVVKGWDVLDKLNNLKCDNKNLQPSPDVNILIKRIFPDDNVNENKIQETKHQPYYIDSIVEKHFYAIGGRNILNNTKSITQYNKIQNAYEYFVKWKKPNKLHYKTDRKFYGRGWSCDYEHWFDGNKLYWWEEGHMIDIDEDKREETGLSKMFSISPLWQLLELGYKFEFFSKENNELIIKSETINGYYYHIYFDSKTYLITKIILYEVDFQYYLIDYLINESIVKNYSMIEGLVLPKGYRWTLRNNESVEVTSTYIINSELYDYEFVPSKK